MRRGFVIFERDAAMSTRVVHDERRMRRRAGENRGEGVRDAARHAGDEDRGRIGAAHDRGGVGTGARTPRGVGSSTRDA